MAEVAHPVGGARLKVGEDRGIRPVEFHRLYTEGPNRITRQAGRTVTPLSFFSNRRTLCYFASLRLIRFPKLFHRGEDALVEFAPQPL